MDAEGGADAVPEGRFVRVELRPAELREGVGAGQGHDRLNLILIELVHQMRNRLHREIGDQETLDLIQQMADMVDDPLFDQAAAR